MTQRSLITVGLKCPRPLFEVSRTMKAMGADEVLEVHADDPAFRPDIEAWCRRTGNQLVSIGGDGERLVALVKKVA